MKNLITIIIFLGAFNLNAQTVTATLTVNGNCKDCKKRIENAADIKGVKNFEWNQETHIATVIYSSDKTSLIEIQEAIAKKGYETQDVKADDKAYEKLPKCCKYKSEKCESK
jgi:copper chaperone CopZ